MSAGSFSRTAAGNRAYGQHCLTFFGACVFADFKTKRKGFTFTQIQSMAFTYHTFFFVSADKFKDKVVNISLF